MSKSTKKKSTQTSSKSSSSNTSKILTKENIKLFSGIFLVVFGCYTFIAVISYFSTWKSDQSLIQNSDSFFSFLFQKNTPIANATGKLGAYLAHIIVYNGIGIMATVFSVWLAALGINILYEKKVIATQKWIRWMAFGILFLCPFLSLIFAKKEFSFGGNLGNTLIDWSNNVAGMAGSVLMLILVFSFFAILVFQWDIKPWLNSIKKLVPKVDIKSPFSNTPNDNSASVETTNLTESVGTSNDNSNDDDYDWDEDEEENENLPATSKPFENNTYSGTLLQVDETLVAKAEDEDLLNFEVVEKSAPAQASLDVAEEQQATQIIQKDGITFELPKEEEVESVSSTQTSSSIDLEESPGVIIPEQAEDKSSISSSIEEEAKIDETLESTEVTGMKVITKKEEDHVQISGNQSIAPDEHYAPELDLRDYKFPVLDLLDDNHMEDIALNAEELSKNKEQIINTLKSFGIEISQIQATVGPTVTLYEIIPQEGVRISKIRNLEDDIALNLAALGIRMIAPIPGKGTIGIEVPNAKKQTVPMRALLSSNKFINNDMSLPIALGKKIDNDNFIVDLASMPHLLMAGATGQGKSVGINAILVSLLYKKHPSQLKFVLVDPKKVELSVYRLIENHYLAKLPNEEESIITDTKKVINTLNSLTTEMDNRYELLKDAGTRNIKEYNNKFIQRKLNPELGHKYLPFIVLVIDEFADLIMTAGKEVEMPVARLAQLARAVGIHLIVATQRPSVNVITGIIKANFPARIAFRVTSKVDSRTILDTGGADQLIGRGDMLVSHGSDLFRVQCAFVDTPEVERIVEYIGNQRGYPHPFELPEYEGAEDEVAEKKDVDLSKRDKMFEECARLVVNSQSGSTSMLQRKFNLGYNRAGRIMDQLEAAGIVGAQVGSKPRDVMVSSEYELDKILQDLSL